jgi:hypothetical protein
VLSNHLQALLFDGGDVRTGLGKLQDALAGVRSDRAH